MKKGQIVWWSFTLIMAFVVIAFFTALAPALLGVFNTTSVQYTAQAAGTTMEQPTAQLNSFTGLIIPILFIVILIGIGLTYVIRR